MLMNQNICKMNNFKHVTLSTINNKHTFTNDKKRFSYNLFHSWRQTHISSFSSVIVNRIEKKPYNQIQKI